jgi:hypothetical protein
MNPFDYVNEINVSKKDIMTGTDNDVLAEKGYDAFLTNRSLSNFPDTVWLANEMNTRHDIDNKLQFHFLLNTVRPKKRFAKWAKKEKTGDVEVIKLYYGYNDVKARQALSVLTDDQIKTIRNRMEKGGRNA